MRNRGRGKTDSKRGSETRERLIAAAHALFSEKGFHPTGIREIASRAGCNVSLIKYYFGSKDGLLKAVHESHFEEMRSMLASAAHGSLPADERLRRTIEVMVESFDQHRDGVRIMFRELMAGGTPYVAEVTRMAGGSQALFVELLETLRREGRLRRTDVPMATSLLLGMMAVYFIAYPVASRMMGKRSPKLIRRLAKQVSEIFMHGVLRDASPSAASGSGIKGADDGVCR